MRILFVTTDEYPYFGTTSNLIKKLVFNGELNKDNKIGVLSIYNRYSQKSFEKVDGVYIYRVLAYEPLYTVDFWRNLKNQKIINRPFAIMEKMLESTYQVIGSRSRFFRPNNIFRLKQALEHIVDGNYDSVIPISGNYDSVIAVLFAKINAKKIFWQVDPCSTNLVRLKREKAISRFIEKKILKEFDLVLTDEIYYNELREIYGSIIDNKVKIFRLPLIDCSNNISRIKRDNKDTIDCVFTGLIYLGIRDPQYTIRLFNELGKDSNIKLHLYGPSKSDVPYKCSNSIEFHDKVNMEEAQKIIQNADFLVNIGNKMNNQIPSKIFEYISTGLPIINICKNRDCPTIKLLNNYGNSITLLEDNELFEIQLKELYIFIKTHFDKKIIKKEIVNNYFDYTPINCVSKLREYIV